MKNKVARARLSLLTYSKGESLAILINNFCAATSYLSLFLRFGFFVVGANYFDRFFSASTVFESFLRFRFLRL